MIKSIADLLLQLQAMEVARLKVEKGIKHGPTIGSMYEGLTRDLLDRAIPEDLNVQVVEGFIEGVDGKHSPQMDALLVHGEGRVLPHTRVSVWPIKNVIAAFEIKKTLHSRGLRDGCEKLKAVSGMHASLVALSEDAAPAANPALHAFARLTGVYADAGRLESLTAEQIWILKILATDQIRPVRIVFGYDGFADELALRTGFIDLLQSSNSPLQWGISSLPNLVVSRTNSLLKMNGQPYILPISPDGWWLGFVSNRENPLRLLIELIWTRLVSQFSTRLLMDDTLQMERLAPLLSLRAPRQRQGPPFVKAHTLTRAELSTVKPTSWNPKAVTESQSVILQMTAAKGTLSIDSPAFREWARSRNENPANLIDDLVEKRLLAWTSERTVRSLAISQSVTAFLPTGQIAATSDMDLFALWLRETGGQLANGYQPPAPKRGQ